MRKVWLSYQLSDWTLLKVGLPLQTHAYGLSSNVEAVSDPKPPGDAPPSAGSRGYMLRARPVTEHLPVLTRIGGFFRYVPLQYRHYFIDMAGDFESYRQKFSSKTRSTIARKVKKFSEHSGGTLRWAAYRTAGELREFFPLARQISVKTYQERLLDAGLPDDADFVDRMVQKASEDGVRAFLLFDGERPVSYLFCPVEKDVLVYEFLGYDPDYQKLSVGTILQWVALESLFEEKRFRYFDFTEGESEHKRLFATHDRRCANIMFLQDDLRAAVLLRSHLALNRLSSRLGNVLARWGVKTRVRRVLRIVG